MGASHASVRGTGYFFLTLKLFFPPAFPTTCKKHVHKQGEEEKQTKKRKNPQDTKNTAFPVILEKYRICLDLYRFSGLSEMQRLRESCKASLLPDYSFSCCTIPSSVSSLTLPHMCPNRSTLFLHLELQDVLQGQKSYFGTSTHVMSKIPFFIT